MSHSHRKKRGAFFREIRVGVGKQKATFGSRATAPVACGKVCFPSKSEAKRRLRSMQGSGFTRPTDHMVVYFCEPCDSYHLGHAPAGCAPLDNIYARQEAPVVKP